jgi:hypothetical protein
MLANAQVGIEQQRENTMIQSRETVGLRPLKPLDACCDRYPGIINQWQMFDSTQFHGQ